MTNHTFSGPDRVRLVQALSRAHLVPFDHKDWSCWGGAMGAAHTVVFHPRDHKHFMECLGITHWGDGCTIILDDSGLTWNGSSPVNAYAWQVCVSLDVGVYEPGTAAEVWDMDQRYGAGIPPWVRQLAAMPPAVREVIQSCPYEVQPYVVRGYLNAEARAMASAVEVWVYKNEIGRWQASKIVDGALQNIADGVFEQAVLTWVRDNVPGAKLMPGAPPVLDPRTQSGEGPVVSPEVFQ